MDESWYSLGSEVRGRGQTILLQEEKYALFPEIYMPGGHRIRSVWPISYGSNAHRSIAADPYADRRGEQGFE